METLQASLTNQNTTATEVGEKLIMAQVAEAELLIKNLLEESEEGKVGSVLVRKKISQSLGNVISPENVQEVLERIRLSGAGPDKSYKIYHQGRSYINQEEFLKNQRELEKTAETAAQKAGQNIQDEIDSDASDSLPTKRENRQNEAKVTKYVRKYLEELYTPPEDDQQEEHGWAFDVHAGRSGGDYENVDIIAFDHRNAIPGVVEPEVISVEVKLSFTAKLVQQANNYRRFCDRVWIAVPVQVQLENAAENIRLHDTLLFNYVLESGLGILAFRKAQGDSYKVQAVHWPRAQFPTRLERHSFMLKQKSTFADAGMPVDRPNRRSKFDD